MKDLLLLVIICFLASTSFVNGSPARSDEKSRGKRAVGTTEGARWILYEEDGKYIIPYKLQLEDPSSGVNVTQLMEEAIADYNTYTCIRFRPRKYEEMFVVIRFVSSGAPAGKCGLAEVGANEGFNHIRIDLSCKDRVAASITHELFHTVYFNHEHTRPDRDDYIQNTWGKQDRDESFSNETLGDYDVFSISHYDHFVLKYGDDHTWQTIKRLSHDDIQSINNAYKCPDTLKVPVELFRRNCWYSPTVVGNGTLYRKKLMYKPMQAVRLVCGDGYKVEGEQYAYCEEGRFTPETLTCSPNVCKDKMNNCEEFAQAAATINGDDMCRNEYYMYQIYSCFETCNGVCQDENVCINPPTLYGYGKYEEHGDLDLHSENQAVLCDEGYTAAGPTKSRCSNGTYDFPHFQCVPSNPPTEDELCNRVTGSCEQFYTDKCSRIDLNVEHGRFVPDQMFYNINDFIQLKCNSEYRPTSSDVAQCRRTQNGSVAWVHAHLSCSKRPHVGGGCVRTPIFDRRTGRLSPMKNGYHKNDKITILCNPGYKPHPSYTTSTCMFGFHPPQLLCIPEDDVCVYTPDMFGPGTKSVSPNMIYYPNGYTLNVKCLMKQYDQNGLNHDQVTCENGQFVPQDFSCPNERSCKYQSVYEDLVKMGVDVPGTLKQVYGNGEHFYIECGFKYLKMTATCTNGMFTYQNVCDTKRKIDIGSNTQYCDRSEMPPIYGRGHIEPNKRVYQHNEVILLRCNPGYTSSTQFGFRCVNGKFDKDELICSQDNCQDYDLDCDQDSCNDPAKRERCQLTCGVCEGAACFSDSIGLLNTQTPVKQVYRHGEEVTVDCINYLIGGFTTVSATCFNGLFDKPVPLCLSENQQMLKYMDDDSEYGHCDLVPPDCSVDMIKSVCPATCRKMLQNS